MENEAASRKPRKIATVFAAVVLVVVVVLTGINAYLIVQFYQNASFRYSIPGSTLFLVAKADDADIGRPTLYLSEEGAIRKTVHYGIAWAAFEIAAPHYGALTIRLKDLQTIESEYLDSERLNETKISYSDGKAGQVYVLIPRLNSVSAQLPLKVEVYPESERLPPSEEPVKISLGHLLLEAEAFDFETQQKLVYELSLEIFIELEMPP